MSFWPVIVPSPVGCNLWERMCELTVTLNNSQTLAMTKVMWKKYFLPTNQHTGSKTHTHTHWCMLAPLHSLVSGYPAVWVPFCHLDRKNRMCVCVCVWHAFACVSVCFAWPACLGASGSFSPRPHRMVGRARGRGGCHDDRLFRWLSGDDSRVKKMEGWWFAYSAGWNIEESVPPAELAGQTRCCLNLPSL